MAPYVSYPLAIAGVYEAPRRGTIRRFLDGIVGFLWNRDGSLQLVWGPCEQLAVRPGVRQLHPQPVGERRVGSAHFVQKSIFSQPEFRLAEGSPDVNESQCSE